MLGQVQKQPVEILDYDLDFARYLNGDTIESATATITPEGGLAVQQIEVDPTLVKVWLEDGDHGTTYKVEVTIDTAGGRRAQVEFRVRVKEI